MEPIKEYYEKIETIRQYILSKHSDYYYTHLLLNNGLEDGILGDLTMLGIRVHQSIKVKSNPGLEWLEFAYNFDLKYYTKNPFTDSYELILNREVLLDKSEFDRYKLSIERSEKITKLKEIINNHS